MMHSADDNTIIIFQPFTTGYTESLILLGIDKKLLFTDTIYIMIETPFPMRNFE